MSEDQSTEEDVLDGFPHAVHWNEVFDNEFKKESDRAAVVLIASMLDKALEELLMIKFVPIASSNDDLFDGPNAPLGTFSAKIAVAHRMGLISSRFCRDLNLIRKIRNDFAHNIHGCTFNDSVVKSRVVELYSGTRKEIKDKFRKQEVPGARGDFDLVCSWMLWFIASETSMCGALQDADLEFGYEGSDVPFD